VYALHLPVHIFTAPSIESHNTALALYGKLAT
jgi:hypothetical protein